MTKGEIISLFIGLNNCSNLAGKKFGYSVARNTQLLKNEVQKIEEARKALIENYIAKGEDEKLMLEDGKYIFKSVTEEKDFNEEFNKLLNEEVDLKTFNIKLEEIPEQATAGQLNGIYSIITE